MRTDFSKPVADVALESVDWLDKDDEIRDRQLASLKTLKILGLRHHCLLCGEDLADAARLVNRSVAYLSCARCGHLQAEELVEEVAGTAFDVVYPALDPIAWRSRCERIYAPKLDWILKCLEQINFPSERALTEHWFEIGAGAGYFLGSLRAAGAINIRGVDANSQLAERANQVLGESLVDCTDKIEAAIEDSNARIFASFFVLEHMADPTAMIRALSAKPAGTVFAFAVPTFGFSSFLDGAFFDHAARSLDNIVHRQLYTDQSIACLLEQMGYVPIARWVFGQDALDLKRLLAKRIQRICEPALATNVEMRLANLLEPLQQAIDLALLADARHVVAVKR